MSTFADKEQKNKNQRITKDSDSTDNLNTNSVFLEDNRPEAVAQRKLQGLVNNNSRIAQFNSNKVRSKNVLSRSSNNGIVQRAEITFKGNIYNLDDKDFIDLVQSLSVAGLVQVAIIIIRDLDENSLNTFVGAINFESLDQLIGEARGWDGNNQQKLSDAIQISKHRRNFSAARINNINLVLSNLECLYFNENQEGMNRIRGNTVRLVNPGGWTKGDAQGLLKLRTFDPNMAFVFVTEHYKYYVRILKEENFALGLRDQDRFEIIKINVAYRPTAQARSDRIGGIKWGAAPFQMNIDEAKQFGQAAGLELANWVDAQPADYKPVSLEFGQPISLFAPNDSGAVPRSFLMMFDLNIKSQTANSRYQSPVRGKNPYGRTANEVGRGIDATEQLAAGVAGEDINYDQFEYEWCHLIGHGDGGLEIFENFVVGTKAVNTEQLAMEGTLRNWRQAFKQKNCRIQLTVDVKLRKWPDDPALNPFMPDEAMFNKRVTTMNVADVILYDIKVINPLTNRTWSVYYRTMDARREKISFEEVLLIEYMVNTKFAALWNDGNFDPDPVVAPSTDVDIDHSDQDKIDDLYISRGVLWNAGGRLRSSITGRILIPSFGEE